MRTIRLVVPALVVLSASTAAGQQRWSLVETLRIGTGEDGPSLFTDIRGIAVGTGGSIFVLDFKTQEIRQFDARGTFLKRVARVGSGPGEIRNANGMELAPNGEIWVNDPANSRFSVFSPAGDFVRQHSIPINSYGYIWDAMFDRAGTLYEGVYIRSAGRSSETMLRRLRGYGAQTDTIERPACAARGYKPDESAYSARTASAGVSMSVPFLASPVSTWDRRGFIWCSSRDAYEILQIGIVRGDTVQRIIAQIPPVPVRSAERDSAIARIHTQFSKMGVADPDFSRVPKVKAAIEALDVDGAGRLWVRRTAETPGPARFDVWEGGKLLARVEAPFRLSPYQHPLFRGDTLYAVTTDEDDVANVVRAVIKR